MPLSDIAILRSSEIVKRIVSTKFDGVADTYILKVRAELTNGWFIECWEHKTPRLKRYSFHIFKDGKMIIRWDNAPHYPRIRGFPHHKHIGERVVGSDEMTARKVLAELENMIRA